MFEIKPAYSIGPNGDDKMVIDEKRDVWLQRIGDVGFDEPLAEIFKLAWGGRVIPFDVQYTVISKGSFLGDTDESSKIRFVSFGSSSGAYYQAKIPAYHFESEEEREAAMLLAVEAMLAYGSIYNGYKKPNGRHRFKYEGKTYIKSDFGLP